MSTKIGLRYGVGAIGRGFRFLGTHKQLLIYGIAPVVIQLALLIGCFPYFLDVIDSLKAAIANFFHFSALAPAASWTDLVAGTIPHAALWQRALRALLWLVVHASFAAIFCLGLLAYLLSIYLIGSLVAGPFNDALSERTETYATGREPPPFSFRLLWQSAGRSVWVELQKVLFALAVSLAMNLLLLIPVVGVPASFCLTVAFGVWWTGALFLDYPMARLRPAGSGVASPSSPCHALQGPPRLRRFGERLRFTWRHRRAATGLGAPFLIPGFLLLFSAPLIVGGTLLYLDLEQQ